MITHSLGKQLVVMPEKFTPHQLNVNSNRVWDDYTIWLWKRRIELHVFHTE